MGEGQVASEKSETPREACEPKSLAAFTALVDHQQRALHVFIFGLVGERELARDLTQDTFHDAWRAALAGNRPFVVGVPEDEQRRWLFTVAYRKAVSALRRRRLIRWESLDLFSGADHMSEGLEIGELSGDSSFEDQIAESEALRAALAQLSPTDVACLLLRIVQGFSASEVARIVSATPEAVAQRLSRARQRLRAAYLAQASERQSLAAQPDHALQKESRQ
ncbi:MAG TPA: sigma-70 family RNA polymerase sigma factor [Ktedonobacterales bacterium]|nr:sigma-70 family RNA polymerase sigma factor [Ktedonobacterales bacterium]